MSEALVLVTFLAAVVVLSIFAHRARIPYPIAFVIGGVALAFSKRLPHPHFDPDVVLLLVLPPLLYSAAWSTDWVLLRKNWRPVTMLAIGLVVFTTIVVAAFVHAVAGFDWPLAFTLGAIVSPPDAVAAEAIFERIAIPGRVAAIITGECLLNDATALVLYRFAVAAAVTGAFSLAKASVEFLVVAAGGLAVGVVTALLLEGLIRYLIRRGYNDPTIAGVIFLLAPFAAYIPAESLNVSGVLAAVAAGIMLGRRSSSFIDSETRLLGSGVWKLLTYILNAFAFLLIGLQLPLILQELAPHVRDYLLYGLAISAVVIAVRVVWVFPATYLPRLLNKHLRERDPLPRWQNITVIAWAGMRGIVSLAAALALPYSLGERAFPERSVAIFFTICVVVVTLVLQGLTLGPLIEKLGVSETSARQKRESNVRIKALEAGLAELSDDRHGESAVEREIADRIIEEYQARIDLLRGKDTQSETSEILAGALDRRLQRAALDAERKAIMSMRSAGQIPDEIFRSIEYDLDLAAIRLN